MIINPFYSWTPLRSFCTWGPYSHHSASRMAALWCIFLKDWWRLVCDVCCSCEWTHFFRRALLNQSRLLDSITFIFYLICKAKQPIGRTEDLSNFDNTKLHIFILSAGYLHMWIPVICIISFYKRDILKRLTWTELKEFAANVFLLVGKKRARERSVGRDCSHRS